MNDQYITTKDAAVELGFSRDKIWRRLKTRKVQQYTFDDRRKRYIQRSDLDRLKDGIGKPTPAAPLTRTRKDS